MSEGKDCGGGDALSNGIKKHRTSLPSPMFSRNDFSIWSILRKCIGMELSKITMPVIFNEPLSFLQRLTEYMEHTYLIHKASSLSDPVERMQCVAAFAVSAVASQWERTGKPFNPLLGETYELVRDDLGFRLISEQVSHHPPISAFHAEGLNNDFIFHGSIYPKLKFWGKSVEAEPKGTITLELLDHNEAYTWTNPTCCVHNIIVGKLWIDQSGDIEIVNHKTKDRCQLKFVPYSYFSKEAARKVTGVVSDSQGKAHYVLSGSWDDQMECSKIVHSSPSSDGRQKTVYQTLPAKLLWRKYPLPENAENMYYFSELALTLNEQEDGVAPTDSRLRPDQRLMERGRWDEANTEKQRLEEKQRLSRRRRLESCTAGCGGEEEKESDGYVPLWFEKRLDPLTGEMACMYKGGYWEAKEKKDWHMCPNIF